MPCRVRRVADRPGQVPFSSHPYRRLPATTEGTDMKTTAAAVVLMVGALALGACGDDGGSDGAARVASDLPQGSEPVELDPAEFTIDIDNPYWPMEVGTRWTYREVDEDGSEVEVVVVVTGDTRQIANGITARVVRDTVTSDGEIVEDTFDWYAQDADGNIWYLGEDTAEFEDGEITTRAGSFEAGVDGARAGSRSPRRPSRACDTARSTTRARPRTTARC